MNRKTYIRFRHGSTIIILLFCAIMLIFNGRSDQISPFGVIFFIAAFSLYFERCKNCRWPVWMKGGSGGIILLRLIGPFYLPGKCAHCGSPDFETPVSEGTQ